MIFADGDPGPEIRRKLNEMVSTWEDALISAVGPQGWSPSLAVVADGARSVLQVIDWVGGEGAKPTVTGYIGATGIVATATLAVDIRGSIGATGPGNTLAIGTVTSAASPSATITGTSPNQTLNLVLPKGDKGDTGNTGPANTLTIGTVTTGAASATITGTAPAQVLNLVVPQGIQGIQGVAGLHGWTPKFAVVTDGTRRVQQVVDWFGGTGSKPATGEYVGATGLVATIAQAVDIRGPAGAGTGSVNPSGIIAANDLAAFADSTGEVIKALKAADLPVSTATQTALNGKAPLNGTGTSGTWPISTTGNAATATKLAIARTINGVDFDGTANITVADATKLPLAGGTMTGAISFAGAQTWPTFNQSTTGNAATATKLATARTINGTAFDGSANISVSVDWASVTGKPAVIAAGADAAAARTAIGAGTSNLADAPSDGKTYGRKNAAWVEASGGGAVRMVQEVLTSGTSWTAPANLVGGRVHARAVGGGSSGAVNTITMSLAGTPGGYAEGIFDVTPSTTYPLQIGAGGVSITASEFTPGAAGGGTTIFGMTAGGGPAHAISARLYAGGSASGGLINLSPFLYQANNSSPWVLVGSTPFGVPGARSGSEYVLATGYGVGGAGGVTSGAPSQAGRPGVIILEYLVSI